MTGPAAASAAHPAAVRLDHASFGYAGRPFTEGVTLTIAPGEVVALLGPNGSGKSTLVRGLLGLNDHVAGRVEVLGTPLASLADRSRLGYVPQRHTLSASVRSTVREVIATGQLAGRPWWRRSTAADRATVVRAAETVGLADRLDADVATLSGGQQRRVLIARALAARPEVLIMDEPTAGVDAANQDVLAAVLRRLAGMGVTMLVVTHELAALRGIVDRIIEMDAGHVAFDGTPRQYAEHRAAISRAADAGHGDHHGYDHHGYDHEDGSEGGLLSGAGPMDGPVEEATP
ncbi:metal ABC transporter ATP-binding protein [Ornithinimicrobium sp. F0845]|uniref:metal ABC transporter ATP-binding protein n=1 Tax=Ornithinimicrobium sp. F0845 TaxID=2926412 RepID=UPI001FF2FB14|nr:metal ABC transporter ATP-binding protein [Ornithinimicrobium sp. F0845]